VCQLTGEGKESEANLILCDVCYRAWCDIEGYTADVSVGGTPCYSRLKEGAAVKGQQETGRETGAEHPYKVSWNERVNQALAELRAALLRDPRLESGGDIIIHVAPGRGELKLQMPPEVRDF
jgi:hypothetical protein